MKKIKVSPGKFILAVVLIMILAAAVACPAAETTEPTTTAPTTSPGATGEPTGIPGGSPTGTPAGSPTGTPAGSPTGTPAGSPTGTPAGSPTGTPAPTETGAPNGAVVPPVSPGGTTSPGVSPSPGGAIGSIEVLGVWGGTELESFEAMVAPWEEETGGQMEFTGTRDLTAVLTTRLQAGNPPDVAILPNPGLMRQFVQAGYLIPLSDLLDMNTITQQYPENWIELGSVDGELYAVFMKATNKATVWYNPQVFEQNNWQVPTTWDEMIALSDEIVAAGGTPANPWSMGMEAAQASGFPGTDWIAQIFLSKYGGEAYDQWVAHEIPWTDPRIKDAWEMFGAIATTEGYVAGGTTAILSTNFQDASYLPFQDPPQAAMYYEGDFVQGFIASQFPDLVAGEDYDFFPFPAVSEDGGAATPGGTPEGSPSPGASPMPMAGGAVTGGADLVVVFTDTPTVRSFVEYLASADAQTIWVERGGFTSLNQDVSLDAYPNDLARKSAQQLIEAEDFRFGAGDVMPGAMQTAWWAAVLQYLQNPDQLDSILEGLEQTAMTAYGPGASPGASPTASPGASPTESPEASPTGEASPTATP